MPARKKHRKSMPADSSKATAAGADSLAQDAIAQLNAAFEMRRSHGPECYVYQRAWREAMEAHQAAELAAGTAPEPGSMQARTHEAVWEAAKLGRLDFLDPNGGVFRPVVLPPWFDYP